MAIREKTWFADMSLFPCYSPLSERRAAAPLHPPLFVGASVPMEVPGPLPTLMSHLPVLQGSAVRKPGPAGLSCRTHFESHVHPGRTNWRRSFISQEAQTPLVRPHVCREAELGGRLPGLGQPVLHVLSRASVLRTSASHLPDPLDARREEGSQSLEWTEHGQTRPREFSSSPSDMSVGD